MLIEDFARSLAAAEREAKALSLLWLYNPLVIGISTRGSAESIIVSLVLLTLHFYRERVFVLAGLAHGLAIHFKIYPIIYSLAYFLSMSEKKGVRNLFDVTASRFRFVLGTLVALVSLTWVFYSIYGDEFIEEAYLYHITRKDIRHNFSVYFYLLYLTVEESDIGISLLTFLPQVILMIVFSKQFSARRDVAFALFCLTVTFVAYNKVCTSQYFLWYLGLVPLVLTKVKLKNREALVCLLVWVVTQCAWLLPAYYLEFQGSHTYQVIWVESLAFFTANVGLLSKFIRKYRAIEVSAHED